MIAYENGCAGLGVKVSREDMRRLQATDGKVFTLTSMRLTCILWRSYDTNERIALVGYICLGMLMRERYTASENNNIGKAEHGSGNPPAGLTADQERAFRRFSWK